MKSIPVLPRINNCRMTLLGQLLWPVTD